METETKTVAYKYKGLSALDNGGGAFFHALQTQCPFEMLKVEINISPMKVFFTQREKNFPDLTSKK